LFFFFSFFRIFSFSKINNKINKSRDERLKKHLVYLTDIFGFVHIVHVPFNQDPENCFSLCISEKKATRIVMSEDTKFIITGDEQNMIKVFERKDRILTQIGAFPLKSSCTSLSSSNNCIVVGDSLGNLYCLKMH